MHAKTLGSVGAKQKSNKAEAWVLETNSTREIRLWKAQKNLKLLKNLWIDVQNKSKVYERAVTALISNNITLAAMRAKLREVNSGEAQSNVTDGIMFSIM